MHIHESPPPGALARIIGMQAEYYAREWGFGLTFEGILAREVGDLAKAMPHPDCRTWAAHDGRTVIGSITIDGRLAPVARLRWFIVDESARGGLGRRLLGEALAFCRDRGFREVWLTTFRGLDTARGLYEAAGFTLEAEAPDTTWGVQVTEQRFRLDLRHEAACRRPPELARVA